MRGDADRYKTFTRRATILLGGQVVLMTVIAGRLYQLQVMDADRYATLADDNRINLQLLAPQRGRLVDRFGEPLAITRQNYRVMLVAEKAGKARASVEALSVVLQLSDTERARLLREIERSRRFMPLLVRENLSWEDVARVEVNAPDLPGVSIEVGRSRFYPYGPMLSHTLGYVGAASEADQDGDPLLTLPNFPVGKDGVEKKHDLALRGEAGALEVEVNAVGRVVRELSREDGEPGREVALAIDLEAQRFAYERLGEESGSVVVLDVKTGEVLVMTSKPGFDPNHFTEGIKGEQWRALMRDPKAPLINKSIAGTYAPGSTFKMMVALAALEAGTANPSNTVFCDGSYQFGDSTFHCWKKEGHGSLNMEGALRNSCDVYFYETARRVGVDRIAAMAKRFGLGQLTGIDLPGERRGLVPTQEWKRATFGAPWHQGESLIAGIGQGFLLATPLQLAVMSARIANGGFSVKPRLTRGIKGIDPDEVAPVPAVEPLGISTPSLELVFRGMDGVVNVPGGTAYGARIIEPQWAMAGKTGTSQVRRITQRERDTGVLKNEELPWNQRDHALFVCFAPVDAPRYACSVIVEHGGGGSRVAAPIARDVMRLVQERESVKPRTPVAGSSGDAT
ncbi:MAG: penicillin-binding protein 2 [Alphaproteobacteria bacterium]|nr:penicillin-binding protein 2 [Alphaproteobacteria bacterium]